MRIFIIACFYLSAIVSSYSQDIQWASEVIEFSSELTPVQYSAEQALGKPNVLPSAGESPSAWTPDFPDRTEFLKLGFATPMKARQVLIAESFSPSTISKVFLYDKNNNEYLINIFNPSSIPLKGRLLSLIFNETSYEVAAIKVEFDGKTVPEYYSIDAIGISASAKPMDVEVELMENLRSDLLAERLSNKVNSVYNEYKPLLSPNGRTLYFSRKNHPENIGGVADAEDIWYSEIDSLGEWKKAVNMGSPLNNEYPNYVSSVTPDGNSLVLMLGNKYLPEGKMVAGVSISTKEDGEWTKPHNIEIENDYNYSEHSNYFLANNRQVILMSVERDDTNGGRDLYVTFSNEEDSVWSAPLNMGTVLNSANNDGTPFLAADNETLYFSSSGHGGYGGYDNYVSIRLDDTWTNWSEPQNLGQDINSERDDMFFSIPLTGDYAYYSQQVGDEDADIFRVELPLVVMPKEVVVISGKLLNKETGKPLEAKIIFEKLSDGTVVGITKTHSKTGDYEIVLPKGELYSYRAVADGFLPGSENVDLREGEIDSARDALVQNLTLVPVKDKATIVLNNVFFDYDKAVLKEESYPELNRLVAFLNKNKNIDANVNGHTDNLGPGEYNMDLAKRRATAVNDFLALKGVPYDRITIKYFGETKPKYSNDTIEGRVKNRRVEFEIVER